MVNEVQILKKSDQAKDFLGKTKFESLNQFLKQQYQQSPN